MKKYFVMLAILGLVALLAGAQGSIKLGNAPTTVELTRSGTDGLSLRYGIDKLDFQEVQTPEGTFVDLWIAHYASTNATGLPKLPLMRQIISVPEDAQVVPSFTTVLRKTISLREAGVYYPLIPRQESISKSTDPSTVPFVVDREFYNGGAWTRESSIRAEEIGHMRGYRLFALDFEPIRYNPASGEIEVIYSAEVEVRFIGANHAATQELRARTFSPAFEGTLRSLLLNPEDSRVTLNRYPMSYVIITPPNFVNALQPFVDWKTREGFNVIVATTTQTGTSANQIKAYLQGLWDAATTENPAPSYLLIVGDVAQVPANTGTTGSHVTDLTYVRLQGTDFVPEMYFGRFSATTEAEVTNQVNKTLMHEMYTMPSDAYLSEVVMIAGVDGYYAQTHANGQINYGTNNYFNPAHGITSHTYLYPASGSSDAQIVADVSAGVGYVNYTAHGSQTSWADPTFTIANINSLQNTNEYPVVVGNCCLTNAFNTGVCFGEAWLRAVDKGAVSYIGGTNSTYWDEDYWWGVGWKPPVVGTGSPFVPGRTGAYDAMFHDHNEPFADWGTNVGAATFMGNMAVVQSNSSRINYYWEIYSIMGDPSLIPYLGIPAQNSFQAPDTMFMGLGSLDIIADPYSYVAISMNNVLHGVGLADENGNLTLNYIPFDEPGTAQIVMTRSLRRPLIANVQVVPNVGPYVTVSPITVIDPNSNGIAEAGETISMGLTFNNVGIETASNLTVTLSTACEYVTLLNSVENLPDIPAGSNVTLNDLFSVFISPSIPDQLLVSFDFSVSDGNNVWTSTRSIVVNAPDLQFGNVTLFDSNGNGFLEPGETVSVTVDITNSGHMPADSGTLDVVVNNPLVSVNNTHFMLPAIGMGVTVPINFTVTLSPDLEDGAVIPVGIAVSAGLQNINHCILLPIGIIGENFETGDFSSFPWQNNSPVPWAVVSGTDNASSGNYGAKSGLITHNASTELSLTLNVGADGNISFWRKVSSEANYDFLRFSIDSTEMGAWSGNQAWAQFSYPVSAGLRTFKWVYSKDVSVSSGSDCAWIDDIIFPMSGSGNIAMIYVPTDEISFTGVLPNQSYSADFMVRNLGSVELSGMVSVPLNFGLAYNGVPLNNDHNYSIPAGQSRTYTLTYVAPDPTVNLELEVIITSNDPIDPAIIIPVHVQGSLSNDDPGIPAITELKGNYPNPFNPETAIRFSTKGSGPVSLKIYNVKGQMVRNLVNKDLPAGDHRIIWNGKDDSGRSVSSGIYMYRMETPDYHKTLKMMLMK
ncbi:MAG: T9SS type A sorting domain-containing protein [Candidatus Syntrophosphaera sp.]|nr:T9SS type A sorting domain-containing protein [Candidatus Syntrophosphaera sp.]